MSNELRACCEAPSITSYIPGMQKGKLGGILCVNFLADNLCLIFGLPERPALCDTFKAYADICSDNRNEDIFFIADLERQISA